MSKREQRDLRRRDGVFYSPDVVVRYIVERTIEPILAKTEIGKEIRILEPACGDGAFLVGAYRALLKWYGTAEPSSVDSYRKRIEIARRHLFAVELNAESAEQARWSLAREVNPDRPNEVVAAIRENIRHGNALIESDVLNSADSAVQPFDWQIEFPVATAEVDGGFDVVLGNPPYVNIRTLTREHGRPINEYLRTRYRCAKRAFDLYVLFCERAYQLLRPGGMCGFIVPNKIGTLEYATECRRMLIEDTMIHSITDVSDCPLFSGASVYPYILVWEKGTPSVSHRLAVVRITSSTDFDQSVPPLLVQQATLSPADGFPLQGEMPVESRVRTMRLEQVARLNCGTAGFQARQVADSLVERNRTKKCDQRELLPFIVSGNIDRFCIRPGHVRFAKKRFSDPGLPRDAGSISDLKRRLFIEPKIIISGLSRRLEAAWDDGGFALGVQVYAVVPTSVDPWYLLALLNSKLFTFLFKLRFQAKKLGGGFLSINRGQLSGLPVRMVEPNDCANMDRQKDLASLARNLTARNAGTSDRKPRQDCRADVLKLENELDALVYQLYGLAADEIELVASSVD